MTTFFKVPLNSRHLSITDKLFKTRKYLLFRGFTVLYFIVIVFQRKDLMYDYFSIKDAEKNTKGADICQKHYSNARIKATNFLTNIAYSRLSKEDCSNWDFIYNLYVSLAQIIFPHCTGKEIANFAWQADRKIQVRQMDVTNLLQIFMPEGNI